MMGRMIWRHHCRILWRSNCSWDVVSNLASFVAKEMALSEEQCHNFAVAGMLHDIGKLRLRSYVYEEKEAKTKYR